jgi:hypothetical protein
VTIAPILVNRGIARTFSPGDARGEALCHRGESPFPIDALDFGRSDKRHFQYFDPDPTWQSLDLPISTGQEKSCALPNIAHSVLVLGTTLLSIEHFIVWRLRH